MKALLRFLGILALAAGVVLVALAFVVYSGSYDVSVKSGHTKLVGGTLNTLMIRSVRAQARDILVPTGGIDFREPAALEKAAAQFEAMCRTCHGAPGKKADPFEFYPAAPDLAEALREKQWTDPEVFWIIKNGIKNTAMSAFGGHHDDNDLWGLTALIRQFSTMPPEQYHALVERGRAKQDQHSSEQRTPDSQQHSDAPKSGQPHKHE